MTPREVYNALQQHRPATLAELTALIGNVRLELIRKRLDHLRAAGCAANTYASDRAGHRAHVWTITGPFPAHLDKPERRGAATPKHDERHERIAAPVTLKPFPWELTETPARATLTSKEQHA